MEGYVIYKLCCDDCDDFYVGSTKNFTRRKSEHKKKSSFHFYKVYEAIRNNGGWDNWRMVVLEELGDVTKRQAEIREEYWRVQVKATLNERKCYRKNAQEYYIENREKILQYQKEHYKEDTSKKLNYMKTYTENNKEHIQEYKKTQKKCDCGRSVSQGHFARHLKSELHKELLAKNE